MNETVIRASLDQALLAIAAIDAADYSKAQAHATISAALAETGNNANGPVTGPQAGRARTPVADRWLDEIQYLAATAATDEIEPIPVVQVDVPVMLHDDESIGQRRSRLRREGTA